MSRYEEWTKSVHGMDDLVKVVLERQRLNIQRNHLNQARRRLIIKSYKHSMKSEWDSIMVELKKTPEAKVFGPEFIELRDKLRLNQENWFSGESYILYRQLTDRVRYVICQMKDLHPEMRRIRKKYHIRFIYNAANHIVKGKCCSTGKTFFKTNYNIFNG